MAEIKKYLILDEENKVVSIIKYDGTTELVLSENHTMHEAVDGVFYDVGMFRQDDGGYAHVWADGTLSVNREETPLP